MIRQLKQLGQPLPAHLQKKKKKKGPKKEQWMSFYLLAHGDLSSDRNLGMGPGPIPFSAIANWSDRYGLNEWEFRELKYFINRLEEVWFEWWEKESKKNEPRKTKK